MSDLDSLSRVSNWTWRKSSHSWQRTPCYIAVATAKSSSLTKSDGIIASRPGSDEASGFPLRMILSEAMDENTWRLVEITIWSIGRSMRYIRDVNKVKDHILHFCHRHSILAIGKDWKQSNDSLHTFLLTESTKKTSLCHVVHIFLKINENVWAN